MKKVIVITGPTGVGKTKLSVMLAKKINGEIINADSMQVYKSLDIGTAKIKEEEKIGIPHHLFDIKDVNDNYTIYDYQKDARCKIDEIIKRCNVPILVGGSGLYIKAALYDYQFNEERYHSEFDNLTNEEILNEIKKVHDTDIHVNNRKRLIRELNKIKNNSINKTNIMEPLYDIKVIGLTTDREKLYNIINKRVDVMINEGLLDYDYKLPGETDFTFDAAAYFSEYEKFRSDSVRLGVEVGLRKIARAANKNFLSRAGFDFVIGSIHVVDEFDIYNPEFFAGKDKAAAFRKYFAVMAEEISLADFDALGHIDYICRVAPYENPEIDYATFKPEIDAVLKIVVERGLRIA